MWKCARWRSSSRGWSCSMCPAAPTQRLMTSTGGHPNGSLRSLAFSRNDSSSRRRHHHFQEMAQPREELPQPPAIGAPACGPTSGAHLLLALEPQEGCWTKEFKEYLTQGTLLEKEEDVERVARQATAYCIQDGELYRRRPNDVSPHCISKEHGKELLADIHGGDCGHHSSSRTLVGKAFCSGFY